MTRYLTIEEVIKINENMILLYSENEHVGVKERPLLESAVFRPQQTLFDNDAYPTIWHKASALFESIGKNHAFHNANKRTALTSLIVFLYLNGYRFVMDQDEAVNFTVDMVKGVYTFEELVAIIRNNTVKADSV